MDAQLPRNLHRPIARPIVDDENLDLIDTLDETRDAPHDVRQRPLLVEAGDLNDQLHRRLYFFT
jgi:hypothetical protein